MEKKILVLSKASLEVKVFAGKDYRYSNLHFTNNFVEATNGYILVRVYHKFCDEASEYSQKEVGLLISGEGIEEIDLSIPKENFDNIKVPKKPKSSMEENVYITKKNGDILATTIYDGNTTSVEIKPVDSEYPNTNYVLQEREGEFKFVIDANLLKVLANYAVKVMDDKIKYPIAFYVNTKNPEDHIRFEFEVSSEQKVEGALMPMKINSI